MTLDLERPVREPEDVHPLGQYDWAICCNVDDVELDALYAWRARADKRLDGVCDRLSARDRRERDVVVNGVVGEEFSQLDRPHVVRTTAQNLRTTSIGLSILALLGRVLSNCLVSGSRTTMKRAMGDTAGGGS